MSKKKISGFIKLQIEAGKANPAPPVGPALGQRGLNIMEFCKAFNAATADLKGSIPVVITAYEDRSFTFVVKKPSNTALLKDYFNIKSGSKTTGREIIHTCQFSEILDCVKKSGKIEDMNAREIEKAAKILSGSARAMGILVENIPE
jgi:large subunit ribosomal protein L11